jgi:hypothetical protein
MTGLSGNGLLNGVHQDVSYRQTKAARMLVAGIVKEAFTLDNSRKRKAFLTEPEPSLQSPRESAYGCIGCVAPNSSQLASADGEVA